MKGRFGTAFLLILVALMAATALMAQGNGGTISGKVVDDKGVPIPGAIVTVTSSFLQGPRGTATNVDGDYVVPFLPPGNDYRITIEAANYNKVIQSNVTVSLGGTTTLQTGLIGGGSEVQVTARPPAVTLKEVKLSTNITQHELETLPISRQYQDTLMLAPTVVSSGSGGNPGVAGSTSTENIFLVNGLNTTDPVTGTFGTNLNYNFIREMEVNTGGYDAEFGASTGGLFNVLTKSGSNEYHGEIFGYYQNQNFNAKAHSTDMSVSKETPFHNYDYGFDIGGPIVKDKLWFFVGYNPSLFTSHYEGTTYTTNIFTGQSLGAPYNYDNLSRNWSWSAKLNWRVNDKHNLELALFGSPSHMWYNEGFFPYLDKMALMTRRYQNSFNAALKWYAQWNSKFFTEVGVGQMYNQLQILPWDDAGYGIPAIFSYNWSPSLSLNAGSGTMDWDDRYNTQLNAKATWLAPRNEVKFGLQYDGLKWENYNGYTGGAQYGVYINKPNTSPISPNLNDYKYYYQYTLQNPQKTEKGSYTAVFLQDKWSIKDWLTLSAGVRWESNEINPQGGTSLKLDDWSPRIGLAWDWARNGKSKFYMNWGEYFERTPISLASSMTPGHASYTDIFRYGQPYIHHAYSTTATVALGGTKPQSNTEFLIGAEYELMPDLTVGLRAQFRELGKVLEDVGYVNSKGELNYVVMNPGSSQWPAYMNNWANYVPGYERFPAPIRNYQGYTLTVNKRFSNRWFMNLNYTWSRLTGNYEGGSGGYSLGQLAPNGSTAYDVPTYYQINNYYGVLPQDRTHQMKIQGSYKFDFGLILGGNFTFQSGRPMDQLYALPRNELVGGEGYILNVPRGSAGYMPSTWSLDVHAEYAFKIMKSELSIFLDVFNLFNRQYQTGYYATYYNTPSTWADVTSGNLTHDPNWGKTTGRQAGRNSRIGVRWSF